MTVEKEYEGDATILKVDGDLAGVNAQELRVKATESLNAGNVDFLVDLADSPGCDSQGLEALTWLCGESQERLGIVQLREVGETFRKILQITRLGELFEHDESTSDEC